MANRHVIRREKRQELSDSLTQWPCDVMSGGGGRKGGEGGIKTGEKR